MKKLSFTLTIIAALTLLFACNNNPNAQTSTVNSQSSIPDSQLSTLNYKLINVPIAYPFTNICSLCGVNIEYTQGDECQIELEGDSAILRYVTTDIESGQLTLGFQTDGNKNINIYESNYNITAHITAPELRLVSLCESGNFTCRGKWTGSNIHIGCLSTGSFYVDSIECESFKFESSYFDHSVFGNIKSDVATVICLRKSSPTFTFDSGDLFVVAEGESHPTIKGRAIKKEISIRGKSQIDDLIP